MWIEREIEDSHSVIPKLLALKYSAKLLQPCAPELSKYNYGSGEESSNLKLGLD